MSPGPLLGLALAGGVGREMTLAASNSHGYLKDRVIYDKLVINAHSYFSPLFLIAAYIQYYSALVPDEQHSG